VWRGPVPISRLELNREEKGDVRLEKDILREEGKGHAEGGRVGGRRGWEVRSWKASFPFLEDRPRLPNRKSREPISETTSS
jgi:hypothetical protein